MAIVSHAPVQRARRASSRKQNNKPALQDCLALFRNVRLVQYPEHRRQALDLKCPASEFPQNAVCFGRERERERETERERLMNEHYAPGIKLIEHSKEGLTVLNGKQILLENEK